MKTKQLDFSSSGELLNETVFVVLDCETTGLSPISNEITEIAAVKILNGEEIGNFQTLINPRQQLSTRISALTGITNEELKNCPTIDEILPTLLEFFGNEILVGHNVKFDLGFINASLKRCGYQSLTNASLDTLALAKKLIPNEVRDFKLSTLARYCSATVSPTHRAYKDVKATIDVFHYLIGRSSSLGVKGINDLYSIPSVQKRTRFLKRDLANDAPKSPGIYMFISKDEEILYVGKSQNIKQRMPSYFLSDDRARTSRLISKSHHLEYITTPTPFEARVAELRILQSLAPEYNVADTRLSRMNYVVADLNEKVPTFRITTGKLQSNQIAYGPFTAKSTAAQFLESITYAFKLRSCNNICIPGKKVSNSECINSLRGFHSCFCIDNWDSLPDYLDRFQESISDFENSYAKVTSGILSEMKCHSEKLQFEKANVLHSYAVSIQKWMNRFFAISTASTAQMDECNSTPRIVSGRPIVRWESADHSETILQATKIIEEANNAAETNFIHSQNANNLFISNAEEFRERYYTANFLAKNNFLKNTLQIPTQTTEAIDQRKTNATTTL